MPQCRGLYTVEQGVATIWHSVTIDRDYKGKTFQLVIPTLIFNPNAYSTLNAAPEIPGLLRVARSSSQGLIRRTS